MTTENGIITLETDTLLYRFGKSGAVTHFADKKTGRNYVRPGSLFAYIADATFYGTEGGRIIPPGSVTAENGLIKVRFADPAVEFCLLPQEFPGNIRFTLVDVRPADAHFGVFVFAAAETEAVGDEFAASALSLHVNCISRDYPGCGSKLGLLVHGELPGSGRAGALLAASRDELPRKTREAASHLARDEFVVSEAGGVDASVFPGASADYIISGDQNVPQDVGAWLDGFLEKGVKQISFHQGGLYRHADFVYRPEAFPGGTAEFRRRVADPMRERGMIPCLHSYTSMVDVGSKFVTPVPSPDLDAMGFYTLAADLDEKADVVPVAEETADIPLLHTMALCNTLYLNIEGEIIAFEGVENRDSGGVFLSCRRGALGTKAAPHPKGAQVKHLSGAFGMFLSVPGSTLFYELALETAKAYNEGGYRAIYLDGLDFICTGMNSHNLHTTKAKKPAYKKPVWYYETLFVREILNNVKETPIFEYSAMNQNLWFSRTRYQAWDYSVTAYQHFIKKHMEENQKLYDLVPELGWFHLCPPAEGWSKYPNWAVTHLYDDDIDHLGGLAVVYNAGLAFVPLADSKTENFPVYARQEKKLQKYRRLRDAKYFDAALLKSARQPGVKFRLVETAGDDGGCGLQRFERLFAFPNFLAEGENAVWLDNPLGAVRPFIRLEARHTGAPYESGGALTLACFDRDKEIEPKTVIDFETPLDLGGREALGVWIKGCGRGYLRLSLESGFSESYVYKGVGYHIVHLDFTGWRYFTLCEPNNGDYPQLVPPEMYRSFREIVDYSKISQVTITLHDGADGVCLSDMRALPVLADPVVNPGAKFNGGSVRFRCALQPGSYLEYAPGDEQAVIYDMYGNGVFCEVEGEVPELPCGRGSVRLLGEAEGSRRLSGHFVVYGETLN